MKMKMIFAALTAGVLFGSTLPVAAADLNTENAASIVRGGQLYDKWWKVNGAAEPSATHPAYPATSKQEGSGTWRCKECHGWDYIGAEGRYSSGSHFSGIVGISGMAGGDTAAIAAAIRGGSHGFTADMLSDADVADLANFVSAGQYDMTSYLADGMSTGDAATGGAVYATVCAGCHGDDGMKIKDMPPMGEIAGNQQETLHKIMFGQPHEAMPALYVFGAQVAADVAAYVATLPK
jgi:mono/diheme cytochrome c family protein